MLVHSQIIIKQTVPRLKAFVESSDYEFMSQSSSSHIADFTFLAKWVDVNPPFIVPSAASTSLILNLSNSGFAHFGSGALIYAYGHPGEEDMSVVQAQAKTVCGFFIVE